MAGLAMIDSVLYSLSVGMRVVGAGGACGEHGAGRRDDGLGDVAKVLRLGGERESNDEEGC